MQSPFRLPPLLRNWVLAFIAPRPLIGALYLPRYIRHWWRFSRQPDVKPLRLIDSYPCLGDWTSTTPFDRHYFYQGAWLARCLAQDQPSGHVDVGSSVSLVSVLSAVTDTLHIDYRPLEVELPGLRCMAGDILKLPLADESVSSLSSLHVIEHIGLGRYGDPIDAQGSRKAAVQLARVLRPGGCLYVSVPIGRERICFNAHRVFAAESVVAMFSSLQLEEFAFVDDRGAFRHRASLESVKGLEFGCGMFKFTKAP